MSSTILAVWRSGGLAVWQVPETDTSRPATGQGRTSRPASGQVTT